MKCPKCESENEWGNFCSGCGAQLRKKCLECGEMERIGRIVCETKIVQIKKEKEQFIASKSWCKRWERPLVVVGILMAISSGILLLGGDLILGLVVDSPSFFVRILIATCLLVGGAFLLLISGETFDLTTAKLKRIEAEFFQIHPDCAELLKKAEGE